MEAFAKQCVDLHRARSKMVHFRDLIFLSIPALHLSQLESFFTGPVSLLDILVRCIELGIIVVPIEISSTRATALFIFRL